jgi:hypothetical protein
MLQSPDSSLEYPAMQQNSPNTRQWQGRHGPVAWIGRSICLLPDGRRLVIENHATKIFDASGEEVDSTPEEVAALLAICGTK